ncbi:MAG: hypothetical protein KDJ65_25270, partial [Anaerolineae bacterium]|nr:hypothetical protein [Anaerolineae bacterium]
MNDETLVSTPQKTAVSHPTQDDTQISLMSNKMTHYLITSLLLNNSLRNKVIKLTQEKKKALAPELGIDIRKLIRISSLLDAREKKYQNIFTFIIGVASVVLFLDFGYELAVLVVSWIILAFVYLDKLNVENNWLLGLVKDKKSYALAWFEQTLENNYGAKIPSRPVPGPNQNLVVYDGFVPFVGAGLNIGGWSFPINISHPREDMGQTTEIKAFTFSELYSAIEQMLRKCEFTGFAACDFLFVNGSQVRDFDWILPNIAKPPITYVGTECVEKYRDENDPTIRYYKWMRIQDQRNDLLLSYFFRFSKRGEYLFVEVNRFLLLPLASRYRIVDDVQEPTTFDEEVGALIGKIINSLIVAPFVAIRSIFGVIGRSYSVIADMDLFGNKERKMEAKMKKDRTFNYGSRTTLRKEVSSNSYEHYFLKLDKEMYVQVFEKQFLEALVNF